MGGGSKEHKWALVAWEKLCHPNILGGLSLRDPETLSSTLGAKTWWHWIKNMDALWSIFWVKKYFPTTSQKDLIHVEGNYPGSIIWNLVWANKHLVTKHSF